MKKLISCILILVLAFSLSATAFAELSTGANAGAQLKLIAMNFGLLRQPNGADPWYYAVTDLDRNGRLEFLACTAESETNIAHVRGWEVTPEGTSLSALHTPYENEMKDADFFLNIMSDSTDTYYDAGRNIWFYIFTNYNHDTLLPEIDYTFDYAFTCGLSLVNGMLYDGTLATKVTSIAAGETSMSITDANSNEITEEQFLNIANTTFAGYPRSSTSFDWFSADEADNLSRFADSYAVFSGDHTGVQDTKNLTVVNNVSSIMITKNPTNENRGVGETAWFVSGANNYSGLSWNFVAPDGSVYSVQDFRNMFPGVSVSGEGTTTLTINGLNLAVSGWGAFCTFTDGYQNARTTTAYMYVYDNAPKNTNSQDYYYNYGLTDDELFDLALIGLVLSDDDYSYLGDQAYYDVWDDSNWDGAAWDSYMDDIWGSNDDYSWMNDMSDEDLLLMMALADSEW